MSLFDKLRHSRTISRDLAVSLGIIVFCISVLFALASYWMTNADVQSRLEQKAEEYLSYLVESLELPVWSMDEAGVSRIGDSFMRGDLVTVLRIKDLPDGRLLFKGEEADTPTTLFQKRPIVHYGQTIGQVELGLTDQPYRQSVNRLLWSTLQISLVIVVVLFIVTELLIGRFLRRPLASLMDGIDRISKGEYNHAFQDFKQKEVRTIINRFQTMAKQIRKRESTLEEVNQRLEEEVKEKERTAAALQKSEERFRRLVDQAADPIFVYNLDGYVLDANQRACDRLGYQRRDLIGMRATEIITGLTESQLKQSIADLKIKRRLTVKNRHRCKDGSVFPVELRLGFLDLAEGPAVLALARDVTLRIKLEKERLEAEAQFHKAQRMESVGTLAGGIAHEFNNLLMAIQGNATLIMATLDQDSPNRKKIATIDQCVQRGQELTHQLLGFARGGKYEIRALNINHLLTRIVDMFGRTRKEITLHTDFQQDVWSLEADESQMEQVLLNILVNAGQAMPAGGEISLATQNVSLTAKDVQAYDLKPGSYVKITIRDSGIGMDKTTREKIFDPFFTTKEVGQGSGLGLASAYGIITNHKGIIQVASNVGQGSIFTIFLPISPKPVKVETPVSPQHLQEKETILLVDDEEMVLDVGHQLLERLGYTVFSAANGEEALQRVQSDGGSIDLAIIDMIMPDMGGSELFDRLKRLNPSLKTILSSGYSINGQASEILRRGCDGFIQKPFTIDMLSQKIRSVLEQI